MDENGNDVSTDEDRMFVDLNGFSYKDRTGKLVKIERCWYEDENGKEVEPDTITGEYSDMPLFSLFWEDPTTRCLTF